MTLQSIDVLILDDEPHARKLLELQIKKNSPLVETIYSTGSPSEARTILEEHPDIQVLFLDIEMPEENGITFLESIDSDGLYPVFVTSHAEYAIDAIKLHAFDYLLKPVDSTELVICLNRVLNEEFRNSVQIESNAQSKFLEIRSNKRTSYVKQDEIIVLSANGSYTNVITDSENILASKNLKTIGTYLNPKWFFRCHNSSIVNLNKVKEIVHEGNYLILTNDEKIICSSKKKEELIEKIRAI